MKSIFTVAALLFALNGMAHAAGENAVFKDTPMARFNADDLALMKAKVRQALGAEPGSETLAWKNDATKASGSVTPIDRHAWNEMSCRRVRITNTWARQTQDGAYRFCEKPAGRWKLSGPVTVQQ